MDSAFLSSLDSSYNIINDDSSIGDFNITTNSINNSIDSSNSIERKRKRSARNDVDHNNTTTSSNDNSYDGNIFDMSLTTDQEIELANCIFEIGLKHSSPKVLIALMPFYPNLNTEHIKSHLQKYRIHYSKSRDEFIQYYINNIKNPCLDWIDSKGWEANSNKKDNLAKNSSLLGSEVSDNELTLEVASDVAHTNSDILASLSEKADNIINEYHKLFTSAINDNERIQSILQISALNSEVDSVANKR